MVDGPRVKVNPLDSLAFSKLCPVTLDDLRVFVATCELGSLSAVARRLGNSQPAVSQHVRRLERELDVTLFERGRHGVAPTAAGRILLAAATDALGALDAGRRELDRLRQGETGALRVATGGTTLRHFMMRPLAEFRARHPGVRFDYVSALSTDQCLDAVRRDQADIGFVTIGDDSGLDHRPAVRTPWVLVVSVDDPLASLPHPRPADLRSVRPIGMPARARSRAQLEDQLAGHGVHLELSATVDDWDTAVRLVELGVGPSIVPALWVHDLATRDTLRARPVDGLDPVTFGWVARRWEALPPYARTFVQLVDDGFRHLEPAARAELLC
jgi:DNA-binding transcriptional LysR family regulator